MRAALLCLFPCRRCRRLAVAVAVAVAVAGLTALLLDQERVPARRARRVRGQPHIDALHVEAMVAPREHAHLLAVVELAEADDTVVGRRRAGLGLVHHHGYPPQLPLLQPGTTTSGCITGSRSGGGRWSHGEGGAAEVEHEAVMDEGVEAERADEDAEQRGEDDDHVGVEACSVAPSPSCCSGRRRRGRRWRDEQRRRRRRRCLGDDDGGAAVVVQHAHGDDGARASV